jgi:hypothetical protein
MNDLMVIALLGLVAVVPTFIGAMKAIGLWPGTKASAKKADEAKLRQQIVEAAQRAVSERMRADGKRIDVRPRLEYVDANSSDIRPRIRRATKPPLGLRTKVLRGNT